MTEIKLGSMSRQAIGKSLLDIVLKLIGYGTMFFHSNLNLWGIMDSILLGIVKKV